MTNEYDFFKYCHYLISDELVSSTFSLEDIYSDTCIYDDTRWNEYHKSICENFKKFINYIHSKKHSGHLYENCKYDEYLNFWLHFHLKNDRNSKFVPSSFYQFLKEKNYYFFVNNFEINIHDIQQELFENMKNLYKLYQKYYDIYEINYAQDPTIGSKCISYANDCVTLYRNFIKDCPTSHASSICIALDDFKNTYDNLKSEGICGNTQLPPLPTYNDITEGQQELPNSEELRTRTADIPGYMSDSEKSKNSSQRETPFAIIGTVLGLGLVLPSLYRVNENSE
ncbi:Plasmodium variant antigen protein Cir/Yir/Bir, putative [Plasmodium ovale]|uniref:Plasmodium variant antigen protein Cir/Yir/Bir, putative n=1 Tax=Plasmodium ovale TaxID=36330 RepID=A0A1C3KK35_PLAOA|nr:Plasmodium variant antigen protein Cir/Yir/Bir, putative [Plasmodium ovale]